jgi:hypothetical protein
VELAPEAVSAGMVRHGVPPAVVEAIVARTLESDEGAEVLPTVGDVLGRPATSFADWARRHRDRFARG